jgi:predicted DNA-binding transcriptional regulator YafY
MRRADRLFSIVQLLRRGRVTTAARLAEELEVSERTIYRDVRDLIGSGVPIQGEAGVGYALPRGFDLPPLMFTEEEIEALVLGARVVRSWADADLARAAGQVLAKVEAVLPERLKGRVEQSALFALNFGADRGELDGLSLLRRAIRLRQRLRFDYTRKDGDGSTRTVRPLCLAFVPPVWLLSAWCELRGAFRNFRVDRVEGAELGERFDDEPGKTLQDFLAQVRAEP